MERFRASRLKRGLWALVFLTVTLSAAPAAHGQRVLRIGSEGPEVVLAQHFLYQLGLLGAAPDGMFGPGTLEAVRQFQEERGLKVDGLVGPRTWSELQEAVFSQQTRIHRVRPNETLWGIARMYGTTVDVLAKVNGVANPSLIRSGLELVVPAVGRPALDIPAAPGVELVHWSEAQEVYSNFKVITVTDVQTGRSFRARRFYGHYHADTEPLTAADTQVLREIYGGWSWERRPIIVQVDGRRIAASMNGVPHGQGSIADNGFPGHFCIHFLGSRIHRTGKIDIRHQTAVLEAAGYAVTDLWLAHQ